MAGIVAKIRTQWERKPDQYWEQETISGTVNAMGTGHTCHFYPQNKKKWKVVVPAPADATRKRRPLPSFPYLISLGPLWNPDFKIFTSMLIRLAYNSYQMLVSKSCCPHKTSWKSVPHLVFYSSVQFVCNGVYLFFRCLGWFIRGYHLGLQDCFLNCFKFQTQLLKQLYSNHPFLLVSVLVRCVL